MLKINETDLIQLSPNESVYKQGIQLARIGAVRNYSYNRTLNAYYALVVEGQKEHEIIIYLNKNMQLHRYQCDCMYNRQNNRACPHIIAALKVILESQKEDKFTSISNQLVIDKILNSKEYNEKNEIKKTRLEVELIVNSDEVKHNPLTQYYIQFKIGLNKKYVVKDVLELMNAIDHNEDLRYGKEFTFRPDIHTFDKAFSKTLDYFRKLSVIDMYAGVRFFEGKKIYLTNYQLKEVLMFWMNRKIQFLDRFVEITDDSFPDYLNLNYQAGSIVVDVSNLKHIISMFDDDTILIDEEMLYIVEPKTAAILHPFFDAIRMGLEQISFEGANRTSFIERTIPHLEKIKTIPENIQNLYVHGRLKAKI